MTENQTFEQVETTLEITPNGAYNNIDPKKGLKHPTATDDEGRVTSYGAQQYIIVEKGPYPEAMVKEGKFGPYGVVSAIYNDTNVSFFIGERDIEFWNRAGTTGDKVKIIAKANVDTDGFRRVSPRGGRPLTYLNFELVQ